MASRAFAFSGDSRSAHLTDSDFSDGGVRSCYFQDHRPHEDPVVRTVRDEFLAMTPATISGATQANPVVITATAHGFTNGYKVRIAGVAGMTQLNGNLYTIAGADANSFQLTGIDGTGFGAYSSGGTATVEEISGTVTISLP